MKIVSLVPAWRAEEERERLGNAVEDYSLWGPRLNDDLRSGALTEESQPERWASDVAPLDRAMVPIPAPMDTTRGVGWDWLPADVDPRDLTPLVGRKMRDRAFTSVSALDRPPLRFAERPILLRMHLLAGTRVLDLAKYGSAFVPERETLLPRGTQWRSAGYTVKDGSGFWIARWNREHARLSDEGRVHGRVLPRMPRPGAPRHAPRRPCAGGWSPAGRSVCT